MPNENECQKLDDFQIVDGPLDSSVHPLVVDEGKTQARRLQNRRPRTRSFPAVMASAAMSFGHSTVPPARPLVGRPCLHAGSPVASQRAGRRLCIRAHPAHGASTHHLDDGSRRTPQYSHLLIRRCLLCGVVGRYEDRVPAATSRRTQRHTEQDAVLAGRVGGGGDPAAASGVTGATNDDRPPGQLRGAVPRRPR